MFSARFTPYHMLHHHSLNPPLFSVSIVAAGSVTHRGFWAVFFFFPFFLKVWPFIFVYAPRSVGAQLGFGSPKLLFRAWKLK